MNRKIILLFLTLTLSLNSQDNNKRSIGPGLSTYYSGSLTPGLAITPFFFYKSIIHEFYIGPDIYCNSYKGVIVGAQLGSRFYFGIKEKSLKFYFDSNFQYVQFGQGLIMPVQYNYLPTDGERREYNLYRTRSFISTIGPGMKLSFLDDFSAFITVNAGMNYFSREWSPTNYQNAGPAPLTKTVLTGQLKLGLAYRFALD